MEFDIRQENNFFFFNIKNVMKNCNEVQNLKSKIFIVYLFIYNNRIYIFRKLYYMFLQG